MRRTINLIVRDGRGQTWLCRPRERGGFHCGQCGRGVLSGRKREKCRVCRSIATERDTE